MGMLVENRIRTPDADDVQQLSCSASLGSRIRAPVLTDCVSQLRLNCHYRVQSGQGALRYIPDAFATYLTPELFAGVRQVMAGEADGTRHDFRATSRQGANQASADHCLSGSRFCNQAQDLASADFEISFIDHWKRSPAALENRDPQIPNIQQNFIGSRVRGDAHQIPCSRRCKPSAMKESDTPDQHNARPGKIVIHQASRTKGRPSLIMTPHSAVGGEAPSDRNDRPATSMITRMKSLRP